MRRLIGVLVAIAVIIGILAIGDVWARHRVQTVMAQHIQSELPGSKASVHISSFPFLGRLAASGKVPEVDANVRDVSAAGLNFSNIRVLIHGLQVDNAKLTSREVVLQKISSGSVVGDITQASIDHLSGAPIVLGSGTVELAGITVTPAVTISENHIVVTLGHLPPLQIPIPQISILPCVGSAAIVPGAVRVSCQLTQLPPALANVSVKF